MEASFFTYPHFFISMKNFMQKSRLGFTLIELLIVVVIIGILSVAFLPTVLSAPKKARDNTRKAHINAIVQAIQTYYSDKGTLPTSNQTSVDSAISNTFPNSTLPNDPSNNKTPYLVKYDSSTKCFIVMTPVAMDILDNGNTDKAPTGTPLVPSADITCGTAPSVAANAAKSYYVVTLSMKE